MSREQKRIREIRQEVERLLKEPDAKKAGAMILKLAAEEEKLNRLVIKDGELVRSKK